MSMRMSICKERSDAFGGARGGDLNVVSGEPLCHATLFKGQG